MSEAKALGMLYRLGLASRSERSSTPAWDGEEPGLLGSTEWAEQHADELQHKALLYINTDNNGRGFLSAEGSHDLQHFVDAAGADVLDPQTGISNVCPRAGRILAEAIPRGEKFGLSWSRLQNLAATSRSARSVRARIIPRSSSTLELRRSISALVVKTLPAEAITRRMTPTTT